jgi:hypothetical protein
MKLLRLRISGYLPIHLSNYPIRPAVGKSLLLHFVKPALGCNELCMKRWDAVLVCAFAATAFFAVGLLVPAHIRAVDQRVIERAGKESFTLPACGIVLARQGNPDAAQMILETARELNLSDANQIATAISEAEKKNPQHEQSMPFTEFAIRLENREKVLNVLQSSSDRTTQELLKLRYLTNTVLFSPSPSASGQAIDAAISICGSLTDNHHLSANLSNAVLSAASQANRGGNTRPIEDVLMDFMSLGQRFTWGQLVAFVSDIPDTATLHQLAGEVRMANGQLPTLFSAVQVTGKPVAIAKYIATFSQSGLADLKTSLRYGSGAVDELTKRNQRIRVSKFPAFFTGLCLRAPVLALVIKWICYVCSGFLLALALHFALPRVSPIERPLQVRGFHYAREVLFSLGFLLVVLLVSEPFLAQESTRTEFRLQLRLPTVSGAVPLAPGGNSTQTFMNPEVLLTMILFFVLQVLLYVASVVKLAEIRRQRVTPRMKLKLLENEEHLFDAGLYLGFFGTIVSLILVSLGVFKQPSLMAAYSSTSFGILFVSFFKIAHLRSARRKLLLEADAAANEEAAAAPVQTYAVT